MKKSKLSYEELIAPRYMVTALWPGHPKGLKVGTILTHSYKKDGSYYFNLSGILLSNKTLDKYTRNLVEVKWWRCRKAGDLPKYAKRGTRVVEVIKWPEKGSHHAVTDRKNGPLVHADLLIPATEKEIEKHINKTGKK